MNTQYCEFKIAQLDARLAGLDAELNAAADATRAALAARLDEYNAMLAEYSKPAGDNPPPDAPPDPAQAYMRDVIAQRIAETGWKLDDLAPEFVAVRIAGKRAQLTTLRDGYAAALADWLAPPTEGSASEGSAS